MRLSLHYVIFVLYLQLLISSSVFAQSKKNDDPMKNTTDVYEQLVQIFPHSVGLDLDKDRALLEGWYSGRCFQSDSQETARNHLRVGWFDFNGEGEVYRSIAVRRGDGTNGGASFFDNLSQPARIDLINYLNSPYGKVTAEDAELNQGSIIAKYHSNTAQYTFVHRKFLHFVVSKWYKNSKLFAYCYSFKKVD